MRYRLEFLGNHDEVFPYEGDVLGDIEAARTLGVFLFATMKANHPVITRFQVLDQNSKIVADGPDEP